MMFYIDMKVLSKTLLLMKMLLITYSTLYDLGNDNK